MGLLKPGELASIATVPVAAALAGGLGFGVGIAGQNVADASHNAGHNLSLAPWTYDDADDQCQDASKIDPVNVVFVLDGYPHEIRQHATDHGAWDNHSGSEQNFKDDFFCTKFDDQSASSCGDCSRFHMRYYMARVRDGSARGHTNYGIHAAADAHHEVVRTCGHSVDSQETDFSFLDPAGSKYWVSGGFNRAREDILKNWVINSDHPQVEARNWDNTTPRTQCDPPFDCNYVGGILVCEDPPPDIAASDGAVYYIGVKT